MEFPFRKLPTRQTLRQVAAFVPDGEVTKVETAVACLKKLGGVYQSVEANLNGVGLSYGRFGVLVMLLLQGEEGATPSELAESGGIKRGTVTGLLDGLEKDGLVERTRSAEDRRMLSVRLTPKGRDVVTGVLPSHFQVVAAAMSGLTHTEMQQLVGLVDKIQTSAAD